MFKISQADGPTETQRDLLSSDRAPFGAKQIGSDNMYRGL